MFKPEEHIYLSSYQTLTTEKKLLKLLLTKEAHQKVVRHDGKEKAQNGPYNQLIKATSCIERSNATFKPEEHSYLSSYQMLTVDKNC